MSLDSRRIRLVPHVLAALSWICAATAAVPFASPRLAAAADIATSAPHAAFATPQAAATALVDALQAHDRTRLAAVLGPGAEKLIDSGDPVEDAQNRAIFLNAYAEKHTIVAGGADRMRLIVGKLEWPLPIPIVRVGGQWRFDSTEGAQEIVDRQIGRNEVAAIRTSLAYVDAQHDYFDRSAGEPGGSRYAQRLVSSEGAYDGLYWPVAAGEPESPLGPLLDTARDEGYPGEVSAGQPIPYQGYFFRVLTGQGPDAPGGAKSYIGANGLMTGGFALVGWPARFGASGIMTFLVNQDGVVFQKDLGPDTASLVQAMTAFNPDLTWARVEIEADH